MLLREGDGFEICRDPKDLENGERPSLLSRPRSQRGAQVDYASWKHFVEGRRETINGMDQALLDSWHRCMDMAVDPAPRSCWDFLPVSQLEPFTNTLEKICGEIETTAYRAIKGKGLLMTFTNAEGRVARTSGDLKVLKQADRLNFGPGANWAEVSVGTNAIGVALATGLPMQVVGEEHFCRSHHSWCCTAAPILDPRGDIWGCFDISGPVESDHTGNMELVLQAARALEQSLSRLYCAELEGQMASLFSSMFNSVTTGVLFLNKKGRITSANGIAELLLSRSVDALRDRKGEEFFDLSPYLAQAKNASLCDPVVIPCRANPGLLARAMPTFSAGGAWLNTIVTITETRHTRQFALSARRNGRAGLPPESVPGFEHVLHDSEPMRRAVRQAANAARTPSTVLLLGESGTGKELFARGIHQAGPRAGQPFVAVNCGAFSEELVQSELFGYREGAFTGAVKRGRVGRFQKADKGVLFLDEISEMPLSQQVNLLRALEERAIVPVGGTSPLPVDVKIVAATNKNLAELVRQGRFREDLYYRLNVVGITIPPLRERGRDIALLAEYHLGRLCDDFGIPCPGIAPDTADIFVSHTWPGNVRELVNCLEFAANNLSGPWLKPGHLPPYLQEKAGTRPAENRQEESRPQGFQLKDREADAIREALDFHKGNISKTAKALGIGRNTLYAKMERYGIEA
ncbi:sigma 54-interacting transcriptional regulator [Pseudodesulfovibrio sp.]|uniref:sigma-54-dependent Fis family transcriptional regulator n=1 Tax=Pseudodesulfovibrio sp. TaxID=2035812 RepID=UPI002607DA30|nr:sigma 54-interacting transcriptional regulator [Pseudodesulfovibrio sp.]MDD3312150.1 sigma 54-interacting transcriptional regulator [Pseudodesulfovibrio sp.]